MNWLQLLQQESIFGCVLIEINCCLRYNKLSSVDVHTSTWDTERTGDGGSLTTQRYVLRQGTRKGLQMGTVSRTSTWDKERTRDGDSLSTQMYILQHGTRKGQEMGAVSQPRRTSIWDMERTGDGGSGK